MLILGIETSCDETAAAVIEDGRGVVSNIVASQVDIHAQFGGIVPEVASRQHMISIVPVIEQAISDAGITGADLHGVAVTYGPGLAGSLLIGVNGAKGFALSHGLPLIGVNHLAGHIYASWLEEADPAQNPGFPLLCLIASGGHSDLVLMQSHNRFTQIARTRDDAAGEAFDKGARILGLGYPGGPAIQEAATHGRGEEPPFTRPNVKNSLDFSFSGLKTALLRRAEDRGIVSENGTGDTLDNRVADVARAFQDAVVDSLVSKTLEAAKQHAVNGILVVGGVAANRLLREQMHNNSRLPVIVPKPGLCTDNGAMIGAAGYYLFQEHPGASQWDLDIVPNLRLG